MSYRAAITLGLTMACCGCGASQDESSRPAPDAKPKSFAHRDLGTDPAVAVLREIRFLDDIESNVDLARTGIESVSFVDVDSQRRTLEDFCREHLVVLVVTVGDTDPLGPWCAAQTGQLIDSYQEFVERGAEVVLVHPVAAAAGGPGRDAFLEASRNRSGDPSRRVPFPVLLDPGWAIVKRLGIRGKPATYIVDRSGVVHFAHVGVDPADRPSVAFMLARLDQLLPEPDPVSHPDTGPIRETGLVGP